MSDRRATFGQPGLSTRAGANRVDPGLVMDDDGNVILITKTGQRVDLGELADAVQASPFVSDETVPGQSDIALPVPPAAEDADVRTMLGVVPYDCYVSACVYTPNLPIVFRDRSGTPNANADRIDTRKWELIRRRYPIGNVPIGIVDLVQAREMQESWFGAGSITTGDAIPPGTLIDGVEIAEDLVVLVTGQEDSSRNMPHVVIDDDGLRLSPVIQAQVQAATPSGARVKVRAKTDGLTLDWADDMIDVLGPSGPVDGVTLEVGDLLLVNALAEQEDGTDLAENFSPGQGSTFPMGENGISVVHGIFLFNGAGEPMTRVDRVDENHVFVKVLGGSTLTGEFYVSARFRALRVQMKVGSEVWREVIADATAWKTADEAAIPGITYTGDPYEMNRAVVAVRDGKTYGGSSWLQTQVIQAPYVMPALKWESSDAVIAVGTYDGQLGGPLTIEETPTYAGVGTANFDRVMLPGVYYTLPIKWDVAQSIKAGDTIIVASRGVTWDADREEGRTFDREYAGEAWAGTTFAPADPGGIMLCTYVPVVETDAAQAFQILGREALPEEALNSYEPGVGSDLLGGSDVTGELSDAVAVGDLSPEQIDPGGGGGGPMYYCIQWFGHYWGKDFPGWLEFVKELRARGQDEVRWACLHQAVAACIGASKVYTDSGGELKFVDPPVSYAEECQDWCDCVNDPLCTEPQIQTDEIGVPEDACVQTRGITLATAIPFIIARPGGPGRVAIAAGLTAAYLIGFEPDKVEVIKEFTMGHTPLGRQSHTYYPEDLIGAQGGYTLPIPAWDSNYGIPGRIPGAWNDWQGSDQSGGNTKFGHIVKLRVWERGRVWERAVAEVTDLQAIREREQQNLADCCIANVFGPVIDTIAGNLPQAGKLNATCVLGSVALSLRAAAGVGIQSCRSEAGPFSFAQITIALWDNEGNPVACKRATWPTNEGHGYNIFTLGALRASRETPGRRVFGWTMEYLATGIVSGTGGPCVPRAGRIVNPYAYAVDPLSRTLNGDVTHVAYPPGGVITNMKPGGLGAVEDSVLLAGVEDPYIDDGTG